jgi:hypothetical protein
MTKGKLLTERQQLEYLEEMSVDMLKGLLNDPVERKVVRASVTLRKWVTACNVLERRAKIEQVDFRNIITPLKAIMENPESECHALAAAEGVFWSGIFKRIEDAETKAAEKPVKKNFRWEEEIS